jgi:hypothetical protein
MPLVFLCISCFSEMVLHFCLESALDYNPPICHLLCSWTTMPDYLFIWDLNNILPRLPSICDPPNLWHLTRLWTKISSITDSWVAGITGISNQDSPMSFFMCRVCIWQKTYDIYLSVHGWFCLTRWYPIPAIPKSDTISFFAMAEY